VRGELAGRTGLEEPDDPAAGRAGQHERIRPQRTVQPVGHRAECAADGGADGGHVGPGDRGVDGPGDGHAGLRGRCELAAGGLRQHLGVEGGERSQQRGGDEDRQH
jgi:hypothetical protein